MRQHDEIHDHPIKITEEYPAKFVSNTVLISIVTYWLVSDGVGSISNVWVCLCCMWKVGVEGVRRM